MEILKNLIKYHGKKLYETGNLLTIHPSLPDLIAPVYNLTLFFKKKFASLAFAQLKILSFDYFLASPCLAIFAIFLFWYFISLHQGFPTFLD